MYATAVCQSRDAAIAPINGRAQIAKTTSISPRKWSSSAATLGRNGRPAAAAAAS